MWPFKKAGSPDFESWPIVRSRPVGKTYGRSISLFINNMQCHLTTLDVYEDGSIDCWGFVDRALFRTKLDTRWIVPAPTEDQELFVFNFGLAPIKGGAWHQTKRSIAKTVDATVKSLNPDMIGLIDMQGSDVERHHEVNIAKMGLSDKQAFRIADATGKEILADNVPILRSANLGLELTRLFVFADGLLRIGPEGDLFPIEELPSRYADGEISNQAPAGSPIRLPGLGEFRPNDAFGWVSVHDRIGEIQDMHNQLNGEPGVIRRCATLFDEYVREPTLQGKEALRAAYEAVPEHLRSYCGDMDTRDTEIQRVLLA